MEPGQLFRVVSSNNVVVVPEGDDNNVVLSKGMKLKILRKNAVIVVRQGEAQAREVGMVLTFHPDNIVVAVRSFGDVKDPVKIEKEDVKDQGKMKMEKEDVKEPKKMKIEKEDDRVGHGLINLTGSKNKPPFLVCYLCK